METQKFGSVDGILEFAIVREQEFYQFYTSLATRDEALRTMFLGLAQEEAKYKLRFEVEYDDMILTDD